MTKKPYARIDYVNCSPDYDYSIVPFSDIAGEIEVFKEDNEDLDEVGFNQWKEHQQLPLITLSIVMMTDAEYETWFEKNIESKA